MSDGPEPTAPGPTHGRTVVFVCHGPSCTERGNPESCLKMRERVAQSAARLDVRVCETTCLDNCATGPNMIVSHEDHIRSGVMGAELDALMDFLVGGVGRTDD